MQSESKLTLKKIFDCFDFDKNGYVDGKELARISREMGEEMSQAEIDKLMAVVDLNKDYKISFEEFWEWWCWGKEKKLEQLVFFKLKALNLLKRVNVEFTRQGASLYQKYEGVQQKHYFAINYGEQLGHIRLKLIHIIKGSSIQDNIDEFIKSIKVQEDPSMIQIIIMIRAQNPKQVADRLVQYKEKVIDYVNKEYEEFMKITDTGEPYQKDMITIMFFQMYNNPGMKLEIIPLEKEVLIKIDFTHPFFIEILQNYYIPTMQSVGSDTLYRAELNFQIKNGFKKFLSKNLQFVKWFFEGFIFQISIETNKDFLKNIFQVLMKNWVEQIKQLQEQQLQQNQPQMKTIEQFIGLGLSLRTSKFHLQFKNINDVNKFFFGMGLADELDKQPTGRQILEEFIQKQELEQIKEQNSFQSIIFEGLNIMREELYAQGQLVVVVPHQILNVTFNLDDLGEIFDLIFHQKQ